MISDPASASAMAIALPMPRLQPVTSACFPSSLNIPMIPKIDSSALNSKKLLTLDQHLHDFAAFLKLAKSPFKVVKRTNIGDQFVERQCAGSGECDRFLEILRFVHARAAHTDLAPEKFEEVYLRRLAEDGDDNYAPAHARQFRHHLYTRFGTRYFKDDIRACGAGLFLNQRDKIGFFGIDYLDAEISQQLDAERIHFRH